MHYDPARVTVIALREARSEETYGGKAASLAKAMSARLPVPDGFALSWDVVASGEYGAVVDAWRALGAECVAVRSSAVGEDSLDASFAGQHVTILNVTNEGMLVDAVRTIHASAHAPSALEYRRKMGVTGDPRIAVVVLRMIDADAAGVLFTRNPVTRAVERVIESAWGLGEAVVAGLVTPDFFRISAEGEILERMAGWKDVKVQMSPSGGTEEINLGAEEAKRLSLSDAQLLALHRLAMRCEEHFGAPQDLEWAFSNGELFLLQSRPITR